MRDEIDEWLQIHGRIKMLGERAGVSVGSIRKYREGQAQMDDIAARIEAAYLSLISGESTPVTLVVPSQLAPAFASIIDAFARAKATPASNPAEKLSTATVSGDSVKLKRNDLSS